MHSFDSKSTLGTRVYVMTVVLLVCVVSSGACFGFVLDRWSGAAVGATTAGLGAGVGILARPRPAMTSAEAVSGDGCRGNNHRGSSFAEPSVATSGWGSTVRWKRLVNE
jgi:hypothetical protein